MARWLIGWLTEWLINWLNGYMTEWMVNWLADWMTRRVTDWLKGWMTEWLTYWPTDWRTYWLFHWLGARLVGWPEHPLASQQFSIYCPLDPKYITVKNVLKDKEKCQIQRRNSLDQASPPRSLLSLRSGETVLLSYLWTKHSATSHTAQFLL